MTVYITNKNDQNLVDDLRVLLTDCFIQITALTVAHEYAQADKLKAMDTLNKIKIILDTIGLHHSMVTLQTKSRHAG